MRNYKTSAMSIMRANKVTTAVRDDHFKGFIAFLDRLQEEGYLSDHYHGELWKYLCCYDELGFDLDGKSRRHTVSLKKKEEKEQEQAL